MAGRGDDPVLLHLAALGPPRVEPFQFLGRISHGQQATSHPAPPAMGRLHSVRVPPGLRVCVSLMRVILLISKVRDELFKEEMRNETHRYSPDRACSTSG